MMSAQVLIVNTKSHRRTTDWRMQSGEVVNNILASCTIHNASLVVLVQYQLTLNVPFVSDMKQFNSDCLIHMAVEMKVLLKT